MLHACTDDFPRIVGHKPYPFLDRPNKPRKLRLRLAARERQTFRLAHMRMALWRAPCNMMLRHSQQVVAFKKQKQRYCSQQPSQVMHLRRPSIASIASKFRPVRSGCHVMSHKPVCHDSIQNSTIRYRTGTSLSVASVSPVSHSNSSSSPGGV